MRRVWAIAVTECLNTLLSRGFLMAVILTPLIMAGSITVQNALRERVDAAERRFGVHDRTGRLFAPIAEAARERNAREIYADGPAGRRQIAPAFTPVLYAPAPGADPEAELSRRVRAGELFAFVVIGPGALAGEPDAAVDYHTATPTFTDLPQWLHLAVNREVRRLRFADAGVPRGVAETVTRLVGLKRLGLVEVDAQGRRREASPFHLGAIFGVPTAAMFLLFLLVFMSAPMLLHGVLEEKQQRIWEVLVSSVTPFTLLLGKLLGAALVSLFLSVFYLGGAIAFARAMGVAGAVPASLYVWFIVFELLALLMYGSLFSAVGAACSELRDAQTLMMPAMLLIAIPMFGWVAILRAPESGFSRALSLFPPATPMLMLLRIAIAPGPAGWEIALGVALTTAFSLACVWAAGKIFRMGILAQGQTPTFGRMLSWLIHA